MKGEGRWTTDGRDRGREDQKVRKGRRLEADSKLKAQR